MLCYLKMETAPSLCQVIIQKSHLEFMSHVILRKQSRILNALSELRVLGGKKSDTFFFLVKEKHINVSNGHGHMAVLFSFFYYFKFLSPLLYIDVIKRQV